MLSASVKIYALLDLVKGVSKNRNIEHTLYTVSVRLSMSNDDKRSLFRRLKPSPNDLPRPPLTAAAKRPSRTRSPRPPRMRTMGLRPPRAPSAAGLAAACPPPP